MITEAELRQNGFDWQNVERCFLWTELSKDFLRQLVEYDEKYKTWLEHALLMDFHGYSVHASAFYKNMYNYLKLGLAEQKELKCYSERVGMMYMDQLQQEQQARIVHSITDYNGRILDSWTI